MKSTQIATQKAPPNENNYFELILYTAIQSKQFIQVFHFVVRYTCTTYRKFEFALKKTPPAE